MRQALPEVPWDVSDLESLRRFLNQLRSVIGEWFDSVTPPEDPTNFTVTGIAGGWYLQWTRSDANAYTLYWSTTNDFTQAVPIWQGEGAEYSHVQGKDAVTHYYWLRGRKGPYMFTNLLGPVSAASLGLAVTVVVPAPPPVSTTTVKVDDAAGSRTDAGGSADRGGRFKPL